MDPLMKRSISSVTSVGKQLGIRGVVDWVQPQFKEIGKKDTVQIKDAGIGHAQIGGKIVATENASLKERTAWRSVAKRSIYKIRI